MEASGIDRLLSYARELGGVQASRVPRKAPAEATTRAAAESQSLQAEGVKITLSGRAPSERPSAAESYDPRVATNDPTPRPGRSAARGAAAGAFAAYERVQAAPLGERVRIKA